MLLLNHILSASDEANIVKIIFGIMVFVMWGIGALVSSVKKQREQEQQRQRQMMEQVRRDMAAGRGNQDAAQRLWGMMADAPRVPPAPPQYPPPGMPEWMGPTS